MCLFLLNGKLHSSEVLIPITLHTAVFIKKSSRIFLHKNTSDFRH